MKGVREVLVYNGVGFIEATSRNAKKKIRYALEMNGFTTFNPKLIKRDGDEPLKTVVTTMEGVKFIASDILDDGDLRAINEAERFYFGSQKEFEEYVSALARAVGLIAPINTRPTAFLLLAVAEKYGIPMRVNIYEHKPVIHMKILRGVAPELVERARRDYDAMMRGEDTGSPVTEFYTVRDGGVMRAQSRRLKAFKGGRVVFDDGSDDVVEMMAGLTDEEFAKGVIKWTGMK